jgi:site-specific recombinase XerD
MATDFAVCLRRFLTGHLAGMRGYSPNTISSYRDAFKLLICYFRDELSVPPEKLTLDLIDAAAVTAFIGWLQTSRRNSPSTRNQRLAAIDSFFSWMQTQDPERMACCQDILQVPPPSTTSQRSLTSACSKPGSCSRCLTARPATADATRHCWRPSTTPPPESKNSPT